MQKEYIVQLLKPLDVEYMAEPVSDREHWKAKLKPIKILNNLKTVMTKKLEVTSEVSKDIQLKLMEGIPLTTICQAKGSPSLSRVYKEIQNNKEFAQEIMNSRRIGVQGYLDKMITELENADSKNIMVIREKLHHYRWLSSKLLPGIYGDQKMVQVDQKIEIKWNTDDQDLTYENEARNVTNSGSTREANKLSHAT